MSRRNGVIGLVVIVLVLYARAFEFEFLRYDDGDYVVNNPGVNGGLSLESLRWALTAFHSSNWHPLTWISHQMDVQVFGLRAGGHHLVNVLLHAVNAVLCFLVLEKATDRRGPSLFVAAAFALHPLRAQSVAWVSERKDVLAGLFFFLTLLAWLRYVRQPSTRRFGLALLAYAAGLASKPSIVTLPLLLLVLDFWPLARHRGEGARRWAALCREKLPFLALAVLTAIVTLNAQEEGGALGSYAFTLGERVGQAFHGYAFYVEKTLLPLGLCYFYPHPAVVHDDWSPLFSGLMFGAVFTALTVGAWRLRERAPAVFAGWLWFVITLLPMIGLVQVGEQAYADRYAYLSTLGLLIALAFQPAVRATWVYPALAALLFWGSFTAIEVGYWRDSRSLFARALQVTNRNSTLR